MSGRAKTMPFKLLQLKSVKFLKAKVALVVSDVEAW